MCLSCVKSGDETRLQLEVKTCFGYQITPKPSGLKNQNLFLRFYGLNRISWIVSSVLRGGTHWAHSGSCIQQSAWLALGI